MKKKTVAEYLQENIKDIIDYRQNGVKCSDIAKIYKTSVSSITRALENNGVYPRNLLPKTKENINLIISDYEQGYSMEYIAKKYGVSRSTISTLLKDNNIKIRPAYKTTYTLNEKFFDIIDTPEKAYIIGMLAADGCVCKNTITLSLQENDKHILEEINSLLGSNRPLHFIKMDVGKNKWSLVITNKYMSNSLISKGIIENKSLFLEYPECITVDLFPHFLRGLLDGDGTIGSTRYHVGYTGTKMLLFNIAEKIENILNIHFYPQKEHCNNDITYSIGIYRQDHCIKFLNYIYQNSTIHLYRKYELYQKYINKTLLIA